MTTKLILTLTALFMQCSYIYSGPKTGRLYDLVEMFSKSNDFQADFKYAPSLSTCNLLMVIGEPDEKSEIEAVKRIIIESYIEGIFLKGNSEMVKKGWHSDCDIVILQNGILTKLPAKYWVDRLAKTPGPLDSKVTYEFTDIRVTGYAAISIVEIFSGGKHLYTDYICLYKFNDGWKIATKIFYTYPKN